MNEFDTKNELSEADWIETQSIDLLLEPRRGTTSFAALSMVVMAILVYEHVNLWLLLGWLGSSFGILFYRYKLKMRCAAGMALANVASKRKFIKKYRFAWTANALTWGASGWLFFANIPVQNQYICAMTLFVVGFVGVLNLNSQRKISAQFINVLMGTQVAGGLVYVGFMHTADITALQCAHLASLLAVWLIFHILDNRFYASFRRNLVLYYQNSSLIQSLNRRTEQLEQEKQVALNANQVIQRFYSSAAHDIRQPVYALKVYADLAMEDITQVPHLLPKINASCNAVEALFSSLFDYEKIKSGFINVLHQTVDIDAVVEEIERTFKPQARARNLQFRVNSISGFLNTDQALILRILTCFVTNAIKYTTRGGVLLAVRKSKSSIDFEVWDTGCGIDKANHALIFEEFFKVGEHANTDDGLGLGLCVVKRLSAFAENSSITVQSRLKRGSVFRFSLPLKIYTPPHIESSMSPQTIRPLLVDHDFNLNEYELSLKI
jgi:signal transduction histidine kinase